jgi:hypothetical protein
MDQPRTGLGRKEGAVNRRGGILVALCLFAAPVAGAYPFTEGGCTLQEAVKVMEGEGWAVKTAVADGLTPVLTSNLGGQPFEVRFYDCVAPRRCGGLQFSLAVPSAAADLYRVNDWNRTRRFGRAFLDADGAAVVQVDVDVSRGSMAQLKEYLGIWSETAAAFTAQFTPAPVVEPPPPVLAQPAPAPETPAPAQALR